MESIEIGEYVRTRQGRITRLIKIATHNVTVGHGLQEYQPYCKFENSHFITADNKEELYKKINKYIIKHSFNLKELVEVGDYVNGKEIKHLKGDIDPSDVGSPKDFAYNYYDDEYGVWRGIAENQVKTILTHEQYEANCYKVKGE